MKGIQPDFLGNKPRGLSYISFIHELNLIYLSVYGINLLDMVHESEVKSALLIWSHLF